MKLIKVIAVFFVIQLTASCGTEVTETVDSEVNKMQLVFLNAEEAYTYHAENSLYAQNQIQQIDVSIILETDLSSKSKEEVRKLYLDHFKENALNWTEKEINSFKELFTDISEEVQRKTPKILPDTLYLIKTTGKETIGKGALYTTSSAILIPRMNTRTSGFGPIKESVKSVLKHELFHIYTGTNKNQREILYDLVGFYEIDLDLEEHAKRIVSNPDADLNWATTITLDGMKKEVILVLYSNEDKWTGNKSLLGLKPGKGYLEEGIFEVIQTGSGYKLKNGLVPLEKEPAIKALQKKVGTTTDYLWAVEEILADTYPLIFEQDNSRPEFDQELIDRLRLELN